MKKQQVLIISEVARENPDMVNALRGEPGWQVSLVSSAEEAITSFYSKSFDVIVIGKGVNTSDEQKLRAVLSHCSFENIILKQKSDDMKILKEDILRLINAKRISNLRQIHVRDSFNPVNQTNNIRIVPFKE